MISEKLLTIHSSVEDMFDAIIEANISVSQRKMNLLPGLIAEIKGISSPSPIDTDELSTISAKMNAILQIKEQIKTVVMNSGVQITDDLTTYGDRIRAISVLNHFEISGPETYTGKNFFLTAYFNNSQVNATSWTITSGSQYATVNSYGRVDIVEGTVNQSITVRASYNRYGTYSDTITIQVSYDNQLVIQCPDTMTGTNGSCVALYNNNTVTPTWSITSGNQYATIDSTGAVTISDSGNITVQAVYSTYTATKQISVVYQANTTTETVVNEDGSTTTTTTTETTDPETGATTTEITSTTTNEDGSTSQVETTVTENTDGSSTTQTTTTNEDGSTSESTTEVSAPDPETGAITTETTTTNYDDEGNEMGSSESTTVENTDGSSTTITTNYNSEGDPTETYNEETDTDGNSSVQQVEYDSNGDPVVTGYTIDTSENSDGTKTFNLDGVNTEFYGFDSVDGFIMNLHFTIDFTDQPANQDQNHHQILTMKRADPSPWYGFQLRQSGTNKYIQLGTQFEFGSNTNKTINPNWIVTNQIAEYDIQIVYDPTAFNNNFVCRELISNKTVATYSETFPDISELRYLTVCIGYGLDSNEQPYRYSNINVLNFSLEKLPKPLALPVITFDSNTISISCSTANSSIYYKLGTRSYKLYSEPIEINEDTVVQAYSKLGTQTSETVSQTCIYDDGIEEPIIICNGEFVEINCSTPSVDIFYRLGTSGSFTLYEGPFDINATTIVQAYSKLDDITSETVSENCVYVPVVLATPVISCADNEVTITCSTVGSSIYYRLDESGNFTQYTEPITISADTVVEAYSTYRNQTSTTVSETCTYTAAHDYSLDYLTFKVLSPGTIKWKALGSGATKTIEYKLNTGNWTEITSTTSGVDIQVSTGDEVSFRGSNNRYCEGNKSNYSGFGGSTATFNIEGNIHSLLYGDNFANTTTLTNTTYHFCQIFKSTNVVSAENLILPALTLKNDCYRAMFSLCSMLQYAPVLPATTLATECYWYMFEGCGIEKAPDLLATTLVNKCYGHMFVGCSNLNYIKCLATSISATECLVTWTGQKNSEANNGVAETGMFVKDSNTTWPTGVSGIPTTWYISNNTVLYPPTTSFDGETIELNCETTEADIYYRLGQEGSYSLYNGTAVPIFEDTVLETYSTDGNQNSETITQSLTYVSETPFEASNKTLSSWRYNGNTITTPYSVNAIDGHSSNYAKGTFNFETSVNLKAAQPTYLWFQHADQSADIYVDNVKVETHWGGYNAFFSDISNYVHRGTNNIKVALCNTTRSTLAPCDADFNFNATLGNVKLFTGPCLPDKQYGYDGMHITSSINGSSATINVETKVPSGADVYLYIKDNGTTIYTDNDTSDGTAMTFTTTLTNITLWSGTSNPKLYDVVLEIYKNGDLYHRYTRPYGFRSYEYAINKQNVPGVEGTYTGFLLNGSPYKLRGVCMHDDLEGKANALNDTDYNQEFAIIQELGCNFIRLAHYPHPKEVYDRCDQLGIIVQTEVPCVKKLQSTMPQDYYDHLTIQYTDMVQQHFNHPCIMFWGLSNETGTDDKAFGKAKIEEYTTLIKSMDSERLVGYVMSHSYNDPSGYYNDPNVDWLGGNIYVGWYINKSSNDPSSAITDRLNRTLTRLSKPLAFSEYGCGGTQHCHSDDFMNTTTTGNYARHDIEYMMWLHEGHIAAIRNYPQLLFTAQWQLFDIAVSSRNEGYTVCLDGETASTDDNLIRLNNKGLVERDHTTKKDPFYLYKAEWNPTPFVHICGKDYTKMTDREIKCYTNDGNTLTMSVNNGQYEEQVTVTDHIAVFSQHTFQSGDVVTVTGGTTSDTFTFA